MLSFSKDRELIEAYDDFIDTFDYDLDYYPDKGAMSAYAQMSKTHLPLTGAAREAFRDTGPFRKEHPGLNQGERCYLIIEKWNKEHPDNMLVNPFAGMYLLSI